MSVSKNVKSGKWEVRTYYKDFTGVRKQKTKRGFEKKSDAIAWERSFHLQQDENLDMYFKDFVEIYIRDKKPRVKYNTWLTKEYIIENKILPYFGNKKVSEIKTSDILQWQNVLPALVGMAVGTYLNRQVFKFGEKVIENLKPELVPDAHKIMGGIRVALPLVTTAILMRWALPVATAFLSGEIEEYKSKKNKKLDVKV